MKQLGSRCLALLFCLLLPCCAAAESKGLFYRVSGGECRLFLLGSIHIGSADMYPLSPIVQKTLQEADALIFECDTESDAALALTRQRMAYAYGDSLRRHISEDLYELLAQVSAQTGYPMTTFNSLKPWAIVSLLSMETTAAEMGGSDLTEAASYGVEKQIRALAADKPSLWLEETADQLDALDGLSDELQAYMLETACRTLLEPESAAGLEASTASWPAWWRDGDAQAFVNAYQQGLEQETRKDLAQEYHQRLISQRNTAMASRLHELMNSHSGQCLFAVIGLMHLVLPGDSVLSQLEAMGYTVTRLER